MTLKPLNIGWILAAIVKNHVKHCITDNLIYTNIKLKIIGKINASFVSSGLVLTL